MNTAATLSSSGTGPSPDALRNYLSERSRTELDELRSELDARLLALENALTSPDDCESLESLVIDLARVAMDEAEAAARRAIFDAQSDAQYRSKPRVPTHEPPSRRHVRRRRRCIAISIPHARTRQRSSAKSKKRAAALKRNAKRARRCRRICRKHARRSIPIARRLSPCAAKSSRRRRRSPRPRTPHARQPAARKKQPRRHPECHRGR